VSDPLNGALFCSLTMSQREMPVFGIVQDHAVIGIIVRPDLTLSHMATHYRSG
jgi:hypothetical protein